MDVSVSPWRSLKTRITLGYVVIFLSGLWSLATYSSLMLRNDLHRQLGEQQQATLSVAAAELDRGLMRRQRWLELFAGEIGPMMAGGRTALQQDLSRHAEGSALFNHGVSVLGRDGLVLADISVPPGRFAPYPLPLASMAAALEGRSRIGVEMIGEGPRMVTVSVPIRDAQGAVAGALTGAVNLENESFISRATAPGYRDSAVYLLVEPSTRRLISGSDRQRQMDTLLEVGVNPELDRLVIGGDGGQVLLSPLGVEVLASSQRIPAAGWQLWSQVPTEVVFAPIREMQRRMMAAALVLTLIAGVLTWWLLRREFAPLQNAVRLLADRTGRGQLAKPLPIVRRDEVGALIGAFNGLLASLAKRQSDLEDSEERFRSVVEWWPEAITVNRDNLRLYANPAALRLMGAHSLQEVVGKSIIDWIHPGDVAALDLTGDLFTRADGSLPLTEARFIRPDGSVLHGELHRVPISFVGEPAMLTVLRDVTARKAAETQLRQLSLAVEQSPDSIVITDAEGHIEYVNDAFVQSSGYDRGLVLGRSMSLLSSGKTSPHTYAALWATLNEGRAWTGEFVNRRRNGSDYIERAIISPLRQQDGRVTHYVAVQQDVTEARRLDEELVQHRHHLQELVDQRTAELAAARESAEQANRAKSRFLAAASHDLRQPLSALSLFVGVLKDRAPPQSLDLVLNIQDCVASLSELLTDLLDVSKLDAGVVVPRLTDFRVKDLLLPLIAVHSAKAHQKGLRLRWRCTQQTHAFSDMVLMRRLLGNLIDNAIKYTGDGGVLVACRHRAGRQWIEVWDTGPGIPEDKTSVIFEEFTQLDEARTRGSGLGLAIVAKTATLLGLQVRLRSRPGRGSVFAIELPKGRATQPDVTGTTPPEMDRLTVAVVDDNTQVLRALVLALDSLGHEVIAGTSADELLSKLDGKLPDLVISDYRLADQETGFDVVRRLREHLGKHPGRPDGQALPAIIVTGDTDPALIRSMAAHGIAVRYKPLQLDSLRAFVNASRTAAETAVATRVERGAGGPLIDR